MSVPTLKLIAVIHKEEDTAYWVSAPDLPGCMACGDTINEAIVSFHEAVEIHVEDMIENNKPLPQPRGETDILAVMKDEPPLQAVTVEIALPHLKTGS